MAGKVAGWSSLPVRAAWTVGAVALVVGGWLLNPSAEAPNPPSPAATLPGSLPQPGLEAKVDAPTQPASAAMPAGVPAPLRTQDPWTSDELRWVRLGLEEDATPAQARRAADVLARCEQAEHAIQFAYSVRDQGGALRQTFEKTPGFNMDGWIKEKQDFQRRCQLFDAATLARRGELLRRAYEGKLPDMARQYLLWLNTNRAAATPELLGKLQREVRQTAEDGDLETLMFYNHSFGALGETEMQRQAYKEAALRIWTEMFGPAGSQERRDSMDRVEKMRREWGWTPPALSTAEHHEADALTERIVDAWRKRH
jgi:hypothetical protein